MSNNRIPENHESSNLYYLEQKKREAVQINFDNKKYFQNLHIVELQPYTPDKYYDTQKDWSEMEAFKEQKKKYTNQNAGISFTLRVKSFFNNVAKTELEIKKKQADVMYEADKKIALEYYNKRAARFYEKRKQQHDDINKLHEMMQYGNVEQVIAYFTFVLQQDNYSIKSGRNLVYCMKIKQAETELPEDETAIKAGKKIQRLIKQKGHKL